MAEETRNSPQKVSEKFKILLPEADIKKVDISEIPVPPLNFFKKRSLNLTNNKEYIPSSLDSFYMIHYEDGNTSYIATHTKTYAINGDTEKLVYIYDEGAQNNQIGYGEIRYNEARKTDYFNNKPFIGYTDTNKDYRRKGLGRRRLRTMNAISLYLYGLPLHSDTLIGNESGSIWKGLLKQGEVYSYKQGKAVRYAFNQR